MTWRLKKVASSLFPFSKIRQQLSFSNSNFGCSILIQLYAFSQRRKYKCAIMLFTQLPLRFLINPAHAKAWRVLGDTPSGRSESTMQTGQVATESWRAIMQPLSPAAIIFCLAVSSESANWWKWTKAPSWKEKTSAYPKTPPSRSNSSWTAEAFLLPGVIWGMPAPWWRKQDEHSHQQLGN